MSDATQPSTPTPEPVICPHCGRWHKPRYNVTVRLHDEEELCASCEKEAQ